MKRDIETILDVLVRQKLNVIFTAEDVREVFRQNGKEVDDGELLEFLTDQNFNGFREMLCEDWFERMLYIVLDYDEDGE